MIVAVRPAPAVPKASCTADASAFVGTMSVSPIARAAMNATATAAGSAAIAATIGTPSARRQPFR